MKRPGSDPHDIDVRWPRAVGPFPIRDGDERGHGRVRIERPHRSRRVRHPRPPSVPRPHCRRNPAAPDANALAVRCPRVIPLGRHLARSRGRVRTKAEQISCKHKNGRILHALYTKNRLGFLKPLDLFPRVSMPDGMGKPRRRLFRRPRAPHDLGTSASSRRLREGIASVVGGLTSSATVLLLLACSGDDPTVLAPPPAPVPTTVTVTPSVASLSSLGETIQLAASVLD